jgi:hypothetical protein
MPCACRNSSTMASMSATGPLCAALSGAALTARQRLTHVGDDAGLAQRPPRHNITVWPVQWQQWIAEYDAVIAARQDIRAVRALHGPGQGRDNFSLCVAGTVAQGHAFWAGLSTPIRFVVDWDVTAAGRRAYRPTQSRLHHGSDAPYGVVNMHGRDAVAPIVHER